MISFLIGACVMFDAGLGNFPKNTKFTVMEVRLELHELEGRIKDWEGKTRVVKTKAFGSQLKECPND
jgi:hypothetical protein